MAIDSLDFEPIKDEERSVLNTDLQIDILGLFEKAIKSAPEANIEENAQRFLTDLVALTSKLDPTEDFIVDDSWKALINAASCIPGSTMRKPFLFTSSVY